MKLRRVVITGMGALTPIGNSVRTFWNNLLSGVSGANYVTHFDASAYRTKFACEVKNFDILEYVDKKESKKLDLFTQFAIAASDEAIKDAGLNTDLVDKHRIGVIFSTGMGGCTSFYDEACSLDMTNPRMSPFFITRVISDIASGQIAIRNGFMGPNYSISSACASSTNAIADSCNYIRLGKADVIVSGGAEAPINPPGLAGFCATRALSIRNDDPKTASRPFDRDRDGFVMGEGAGVLVLEELEHAKRRNANILAEITGTGLSADAYHITLPHPEGYGAELSMKYALEDANLGIRDIDSINAHGTSTPSGDLAEIKAICSLFGEYSKNIAITANKSSLGHLLGAAGAVEAIASILSIRNSIVPPTINTKNIDSNINSELNLTIDKAQKRDVRTVISNSFGFGGHNTSILFQKYDE